MKKEIIIDSLPGFQPSAKIGKISVSVGDEIKEEDLILSIEGKKGSKDLRSPLEGKVLSIELEEGEEVTTGSVAIIVESEERVKSFENIDLVIDSLPGFQPTAKVGKIMVEKGQEVKAGDVILNIEGKKGNKEFRSTVDGNICSIELEEGEEIVPGQLVAVITTIGACEIKDEVKELSNEVHKAEVVVLGGGPGGYVAAIRASQTGKDVILIEEDSLGGTCLNRGCIPTKSMVESLKVHEMVKNAGSFGIDAASGELSMENIMDRKNMVVDTLVSGIDASMDKHSIKVLRGRGYGYDENSLVVELGDKNVKVEFEKLILATGSIVSLPGFEGSEADDILTSDELLELREIPESLIILGGRVIAMEFAFIYNKLGSKVTVIQRSDTIFPNMDRDIVDIVRESALGSGINLIEGSSVKSIKSTADGGKVVVFQQDGEEKLVAAEKLAIATGRKPNLEGLNLDKLAVEISPETRGIKVNEHMQTSNENIYAIGDATNLYNLAHVASKQGLVAVDNINGIPSKMSYDAVPEAVFTTPEIGLVGMSEKDCKKNGIDYIVGKFPYMNNGKALVANETNGFIKVIAERESREIIGAGLVGLMATDLLSVYGNLVTNRVKIDDAKNVIYAHPTVSETAFEAILDLDKESLHK